MFTCGDTRARYDAAINGFTPGAPEPRKFSSSPVGVRTSTPPARAQRSRLITVPFTRKTTSPIPEACRLLVKVWSVLPMGSLMLKKWYSPPNAERSLQLRSEEHTSELQSQFHL